MDDKLKVFWNLDILVKMCRSKSDGSALRVEETEIEEKIAGYKEEVEDINSQLDEESYDTSAEMADRNIEIITKKLLKTLRSNLRDKNQELEALKEKENDYYKDTSVLRETKNSYENYILSMQERIDETTDQDTILRYTRLIAETQEKIDKISAELETGNAAYTDIQQKILDVSDDITQLEEAIEKKKRLLDETQTNLEHRETYIDKTKKEKNIKRVEELEAKIEKLNERLEEIRKDPKYIETKIKDVINDKEETVLARDYLVELINIAIKQPYINVPTDNALEEELLRATQARDMFANEIDQKKYDILESDTPEKIRTEFLKKRIEKWESELKTLQEKILIIDKDEEFGYEEKDKRISNMIETMKLDLEEYQKAYDSTPESNLGAKATAKVSLDEKKEDILAAERIAQSFKQDQSEDIAEVTKVINKEIEDLNNKIREAFDEMDEIKNRLLSKKSGALDIASQNKDKERLKDLAQIVVDIKHRRQFAEPPIEIAHRLEEILQIDLTSGIDMDYINTHNKIEEKDYEEYILDEPEEKIELVEVNDDNLKTEEPVGEQEDKRGYKVIEEVEITNPVVYFDEQEEGTASELTEKGIESIEAPLEELKEKEELVEDTPAGEMETLVTDTSEEILDKESEIVSAEPTEEETETTEPVEEKLNIPEPEEELVKEEKLKKDPEKNQEEKIENEDSDDEDDDLSINSIFKNEKDKTNDENDDNISEGLLNELDEYINKLNSKESE